MRSDEFIFKPQSHPDVVVVKHVYSPTNLQKTQGELLRDLFIQCKASSDGFKLATTKEKAEESMAKPNIEVSLRTAHNLCCFGINYDQWNSSSQSALGKGVSYKYKCPPDEARIIEQLQMFLFLNNGSRVNSWLGFRANNKLSALFSERNQKNTVPVIGLIPGGNDRNVSVCGLCRRSEAGFELFYCILNQGQLNQDILKTLEEIPTSKFIRLEAESEVFAAPITLVGEENDSEIIVCKFQILKED